MAGNEFNELLLCCLRNVFNSDGNGLLSSANGVTVLQQTGYDFILPCIVAYVISYKELKLQELKWLHF